MRVGLIDVDSHNFPNLCLMKLSEYHTRRGDRVEWWDPVKQYDLVYKSRVFTDTYSKDTIQVNNADKVIQGGTGYGPGENLPHEIEHIRPDYFSISAVFRYSLRLFKPWLSKELRILYCQQKRRAQERPGG